MLTAKGKRRQQLRTGIAEAGEHEHLRHGTARVAEKARELGRVCHWVEAQPCGFGARAPEEMMVLVIM